jgi:hypothetical protein
VALALPVVLELSACVNATSELERSWDGPHEDRINRFDSDEALSCVQAGNSGASTRASPSQTCELLGSKALSAIR